MSRHGDRVDRELRRRPTGLVEVTEQDRYYDGSTATVGALDAWGDGQPWTDDLDDHEAEL